MAVMDSRAFIKHFIHLVGGYKSANLPSEIVSSIIAIYFIYQPRINIPQHNEIEENNDNPYKY